MKNRTAALEEQAEKFFESLPDKVCDFKLEKIFVEEEDRFIYFSFGNEDKHKDLTAYFHEETSEFKIRVKIGLNEFCLTEFFTENFEHFCDILQSQLQTVIEKLSANEDMNPLIQEKKFDAWEYGKNLPTSLEGFELFISPQNPVSFTNGSHIIINYSNFETLSDLTIYYNIYGDNFSGELRIKNVPHVTYSFDAANLKELEIKLIENLEIELHKINKLGNLDNVV